MPRWSSIFRLYRQQGVVFFHPPSGEERTKRVDPKTGKVFCPGGNTLDVNKRSSRVRVGTRAGGIYAVVRSVEEGPALLEEWEVVTARINRLID